MARRRTGALLTTMIALATMLFAWFLVAPSQATAATGFEEVRSFGSNPGNLEMYTYVPTNLPANAPLVVLFHGCGGQAQDLDVNTGWREMADRWKFVLVMPEQKDENVGSGGIVPHKCMSVWNDQDRTRAGVGEAASVIQMVETARASYGTDASRQFVTGYSGGGAATNVMLAAYPDRFKAGSVFFGMPYACADTEDGYFTTGSRGTCSGSTTTLTPAQQGDRIRAGYPGYSGARPPVQIWHGGADRLISPKSMDYQRDGWTNVHGISATPTSTSTPVAGVTKSVYGSGQVETWLVTNMGHSAPVAPGTGTEKCGASGTGYDLICGPYHAVKFFGLDGATPTPNPTPTPTPTPTPNPTPACFTATPSQHVAAQRATQRFFTVSAVGTGDYVGLSTSRTAKSLREIAPGSYQLVSSC